MSDPTLTPIIIQLNRWLKTHTTLSPGSPPVKLEIMVPNLETAARLANRIGREFQWAMSEPSENNFMDPGRTMRLAGIDVSFRWYENNGTVSKKMPLPVHVAL